jgi:lipid-A-disaccharide synthase
MTPASPASSVHRPSTLNICIVAAEESGDRLGAALMRALKSTGRPTRFTGVGGRAMMDEGVQPLVPLQNVALIGFGIIRHLPAIYRYIRDVAWSIAVESPDVVVIVDSPDLTHPIARRIRKYAPSIPIIDYVSPSVWAWRPGRARAMRSYVDHVLALLPFEPETHARLGGPACSYVGHPLVEQIDDLRPSSNEAVLREADPPTLLVLPGSRPGEIRRLLGVFGDTIERLHERIGTFQVVLPTVPNLAAQVRARTANWAVQPRIVVEPAEKWAAFRIARAALAKSGTVTLELALAGVPMVAAYKVSLFDEIIARIAVNVPSVILANLIIGQNVVPEKLQRDCTAQNLADALEPLLINSRQRQSQLDAFAKLDAIMEIGRADPSRRAAEIVVQYAGMRDRSENRCVNLRAASQ